jgi:hypothetical protein
MTTKIEYPVVTSIRGKQIGLDIAGRLVTPGGYLSGPGPAAGAGATSGTGTVHRSSVVKLGGGVIRTYIYLDLTGLASSTTDLDIIGVGASAAYIARITNALNGEIFAGRMACIEVPAGGADDIDLYAATEGTGVYDAGVATLAETALLTSGGAWTRVPKLLTALPVADAYLYLTGGEAGTAATYTAGKFLIELDGYEALG